MASQGTQQYRVRNWAEYNKSLVQRGSLTIWLEEETLKNWYANVSVPKRGRPWKYSAVAIECVLSIQTFFKVPLRAAQGLMHIESAQQIFRIRAIAKNIMHHQPDHVGLVVAVLFGLN